MHIPTIAPCARHTGKPRLPHLEVALLQVLERRVGHRLGGAGQVDLAVLADDAAVRADEDRGVEAAGRAVFLAELGVAEMEPDPEPPRLVEQRLRRGAGHLALEPGIDLVLRVVEPARKERGEREFGIDDKLAPAVRCLAHQVDEAFDHALARIGEVDGTELRGGGDETAGHGAFPLDGGVYAGEAAASDRRVMRDASSWRKPPGDAIPIAASYLRTGDHFRKPGSTVKIDAARDI